MPPQEMIVGDNWLAIIVAAIAFYAIGFIIYGAVFSKLWMQVSGYTQEQLKPHMWKMAISTIMPVLTAIGLAIILKMCGVTNLAAGLVVTSQIWFFLILSTRLYSFVYSPERPGLLIMDAIHLLLGFLAAGAVISAWP
jgi:hypothetical protein